MFRLRRKIDSFLVDWKNRSDHLPLIVKGARQIGKTDAIRHFAAAHYENIVEINFVLQKSSLVPVEVKAENNPTPSLNKLIANDKYPDIRFGIKLANCNIGFNGRFYSFPYFMTFLLKRYLRERTPAVCHAGSTT